MKNLYLAVMLAVFIFACRTEIKAQADKQAEKVVKALGKKDCTKAQSLAPSVKSVDYMDEYGNTLLTLSANAGCIDVIRTLLNMGYNINLQRSDGETALMIASSNGNTELVKLLLEKGAKVDLQTTEYGSTALIMASIAGHSEIVKLLLDSGAVADIQSKGARGHCIDYGFSKRA